MMPAANCTLASSMLMRFALPDVHMRSATMNQMKAIPENGSR